MKNKYTNHREAASNTSKTALFGVIKAANERMKASTQRLSNRVFDVAAGPLLLTIIGIPVLLLVIVAILVIVTVRLIKRARKKNLEIKETPDESKSPGNDK